MIIFILVQYACCWPFSFEKRQVLENSYKNTLTSQEWEDIRLELYHIMARIPTPLEESLPPTSKGYNLGYPVGPTIVRLAWHQAATYDSKTKTGGPHATLNTSLPIHGGLKRAVNVLDPLYKQYEGKISQADLWSFAASCYITNYGGPEIKWRPGRKDHPINASVSTRIPFAEMNVSTIQSFFNRMGLNDAEIVTLMGTHSIGFASPKNSGYKGSWTHQQELLTNDYFIRLVALKDGGAANYTWQNTTKDAFNYTIKPQWVASDSSKMLPSDVLLINNPKWEPIVRKFAKDQNEFFKSYSKTFQKLNELGMKSNEMGSFVSTKFKTSYRLNYSQGSTVMTNPVRVYLTFYGSWNSEDVEMIQKVANGISGTLWFKKIKKYYYQAAGSKAKTFVDGSVKLVASTSVKNTNGTVLYPGDAANIISSQIGAGRPFGDADKDGVYVFLFSSDVSETSVFGAYCVSWCSYHTKIDFGTLSLPYLSIGYPNPKAEAPEGCTACSSLIPNANGREKYGVDQVIRLLAEGLVNTIVNPIDLGWIDNSGREPMDFCWGNYGNLASLNITSDRVSNLKADGVAIQVAQFVDPSNSKCT